MTALRPLPVRVRPHHLETPRSYLARMCAANLNEREPVEALIRARQKFSRDPNELGKVITELGGPSIKHFEHAYRRSGQVAKRPGEAMRRQRTGRSACRFCTGGMRVATYDHSLFNVCLKHSMWVGPGSGTNQQVRVEACFATPERRFRRAIRSPFVDRDLCETVWELVRDNATMLDNGDWGSRVAGARARSDYVAGVHDRAALFPETVRVIDMMTDLMLWGAVQQNYDERLRATLRQRLDWVGKDRWVLVEGLSLAMTRSRPRVAWLDALVVADVRRDLARGGKDVPALRA